MASYFEVLKRVLRREPYLQYGRQTFFSNFWAEAAREVTRRKRPDLLGQDGSATRPEGAQGRDER